MNFRSPPTTVPCRSYRSPDRYPPTVCGGKLYRLCGLDNGSRADRPYHVSRGRLYAARVLEASKTSNGQYGRHTIGRRRTNRWLSGGLIERRGLGLQLCSFDLKGLDPVARLLYHKGADAGNAALTSPDGAGVAGVIDGTNPIQYGTDNWWELGASGVMI